MTRLALVLAAVCLLAGCSRVSDGAAVAQRGPASASSTGMSTSATPPPTTAAPADEPLDFGVVPTQRTPLPPDAQTCAPAPRPAAEATVTVPDPAAPRVTVAVPDGFGPARPGDGGVVIPGRDGISATVTITATDEEPAVAFESYIDRLVADSNINTVSVLPGELCDYSGQELMGSLSNSEADAVQYRDRIVHIWTDDGPTYLVAVHVSGPATAPGFDDAAQVFTQDFGVVVP